MEIIRWDDVPKETLAEGVARRVVWGEHSTLVRFEFAKSMHATAHHHPAEQHTWVVSGALRVASGGRDWTVRAGEMLLVPGSAEHEVWALEDSVVLCFFAPARHDWKSEDGGSHYLTGG